MLPSFSSGHAALSMTLVALVMVAAHGCRSESTPESRIAAVDALLAAYAGTDGPGASLLVVRDDEILYQKAYGLADVENGVAATTATNYRLASVSKQFTATSVMMLIERGAFAYETRLTDLFDGFPDYGADITVSQLLSHTSGLIDYEDLIPDSATVQVKDADVLEMMKGQDSTYFEPGSEYRYSNTAYALLAMAVEQTSGLRFADFLKQNIFDVLGMTGTVAYENGISTVDNRAFGSIWSDSAGVYIRRDQSITSAVLGDGGIYSSVEDLYRWDQALYTDQLLPASVFEDAWKAKVNTEHNSNTADGGNEEYGYGWYVGNHDGRRYIRHGGSTAGFRNAVLRYPDQRLSVWLLTNRNSPDVEGLAKSVADVYAFAAAGLAPVTSPTSVQTLTDHHVHVLSPDLVRDWKSLGVPFSRPDSLYTSAAALPVAQGVLVPMGHLYANSEFRGALGLDDADATARLRRENDWVASAAAADPERFVALCSVNPLRDWVDDELERCRTELGVAGIKIHVASSGIDLRRSEHLMALARVAEKVAEYDLLLLVHLDPQMRGHEVADITNFAETVLGPHPTLRVIVAHLGGSGGYGSWSRAVFGALTDWLEANPERDVWFDLSAVILAEESEGVPATTPAEAAALAADLRRAGLERIVFGSDYPVFAPESYRDLLADRAGLDPDELRRIVSNRVPGIWGSR